MTNLGLPTDMLINAHIRRAAREGITITVLRHGDNASGTIILKINRLNGTAHVLMQVRYEDESVWAPATRIDPMPEAEADLYLDRQAHIDPDSWILEIEDKLGRHWFEGRVVQF